MSIVGETIVGAVAAVQIPVQDVRAGLHDGADDAVLLVADAGQAAEHRQEEVVGVGRAHLRRDAMVQLHGRAERDVGLLDAALQGRAIAASVHHELEAELVQEGGEEGEQALEDELVGERDARRAVRRLSRVGDTAATSSSRSRKGSGRGPGASCCRCPCRRASSRRPR